MSPTIDEAPSELADAVREFWTSDQWDNAVAIAQLESNWSAFALADTTGPNTPCGALLYLRDGVRVTAELSVGWFQINACNLPPGWRWEHLYNTRHNVGTAHLLYTEAGGWSPWYYSAKQLGLL